MDQSVAKFWQRVDSLKESRRERLQGSMGAQSVLAVIAPPCAVHI